jgi:hypothetical protein
VAFRAAAKVTSMSLTNKIIEFLQDEAPEEIEGLHLNLLSQMVENGIIRARSHGFTEDNAVQDYVQLMFEIAPNFDQNPAFAKALRETSGFDQDVRAHSILERISEEEWNQAADAYDENAWGIPLEDE